MHSIVTLQQAQGERGTDGLFFLRGELVKPHVTHAANEQNRYREPSVVECTEAPNLARQWIRDNL